jgi:hypothetical protein
MMDDDDVAEAEWAAKRRACLDLIETVEAEALDHFGERIARSHLNEALYAFSERDLIWNMDIEIKDLAEAIRVWAVVEQVRRHGFPEDLRM